MAGRSLFKKRIPFGILQLKKQKHWFQSKALKLQIQICWFEVKKNTKQNRNQYEIYIES